MTKNKYYNKYSNPVHIFWYPIEELISSDIAYNNYVSNSTRRLRYMQRKHQELVLKFNSDLNKII